MDKIYGRNAVIEAFLAKRDIKKAYIIKEDSKIIKKIIDLCQKNNVDINYVDKRFFEKTKINHQGVMVYADEFEYKDINDTLDDDFIVILDKIEDPHNLGAIIRSCEAMGVDSVIIPEHKSAKINSTVYKTSAGAVNFMKIIMVKNITRTIKELKDNRFWVYGLAGEASEYIYDTDLKGKVALVIGNEGKGISRLVKENCDMLIKIPMTGKINSLNASVAAAISIYEVLRQNGKS
ncbi:MAG: 23S rRNA (guanosine(2251)-2'-O)-methyltransferase RlmB [Tissierellia bacterium]|nr:23S rRNA (guanosine(2251)-2'-O)-methyltransferase RlmB [Tissierellia bacterium]